MEEGALGGLEEAAAAERKAGEALTVEVAEMEASTTAESDQKERTRQEWWMASTGGCRFLCLVEGPGCDWLVPPHRIHTPQIQPPHHSRGGGQGGARRAQDQSRSAHQRGGMWASFVYILV